MRLQTLSILCLLVIIRLKSECCTSQKRISLSSYSFLPCKKISQVKRRVSAWLQINHRSSVSEFFTPKNYSIFFFFWMTNCDVGCILFIVLVLNNCKPNLREILWQDLPPPTPLFHWASITATLKYH